MAKVLEILKPIRNHNSPLVYDPFLGSGTTLIAAERTGRCCRGLDIDPADSRVGVRAANDRRVQQVRELDVVDVAPAAGEAADHSGVSMKPSTVTVPLVVQPARLPVKVPLLTPGVLPTVGTGTPGSPAITDIAGDGSLRIAIFEQEVVALGCEDLEQALCAREALRRRDDARPAPQRPARGPAATPSAAWI